MILRRVAGLRSAATVLALLAAAPLPLSTMAAAGASPRPRPVAPAFDPEAEAILFAMPRITEALHVAFAQFRAGDRAEAERLVDALIERHPGSGLLHASRAGLAVLAEAPDLALDHLERAAQLGTPNLSELVAHPVFAPLRGDPERGVQLQGLLRPRPETGALPSPVPAHNGIAAVSAANTIWDPGTERLKPRFTLPSRPISNHVLPPEPRDNARELLREHWRRGRAAGNHGDLYDNRDRGHSALDLTEFPQVTRVTYAEAARQADVDYGLNDGILFDRVTFGNSSTALTNGPYWRSLPRHAMTRADGTGPMRMWQNASANHFYVYPAHQDYGRERGDLFPANTPYLLVSRGSSGSDRPFLEAIVMILASFKPATKARLIEERLVVPTVQFVFRRSLQNVRSRDSYFSGDAHPAAFEARHINLGRMVSLAQSIEPDAIPAEVRIAVEEEELGREGIDFFGVGLSEQLFDTPSAIARIWRARTGRRSMIVSAEASHDPNDRPLSFHWRLLQGDPERVMIEPLGDGSRARITLDWHDRFPISDENPQLTARVDVGVFAHNGAHDSAPAILSWYFPPNESRRYEIGPDGAPRLAEIHHADPAKAGIYADPLLLPRADWRDVFAYDEAGQPTGWTRHRGDRVDRFDAAGRRLAGNDPARPEPVAYQIAPRDDGTLQVEEVSVTLSGG